MKFCMDVQHIPPHLERVATLPCDVLISFYKYFTGSIAKCLHLPCDVLISFLVYKYLTGSIVKCLRYVGIFNNDFISTQCTSTIVDVADLLQLLKIYHGSVFEPPCSFFLY